MKKLLFLCLFLLLALLQEAAAQNRTITGKVTDATSREGLPGVTVLVKGTQAGTATDATGNYSIAVPAGGTTLVYSFIGYTTIERPIGGSTTINVALATDATQLNEVVVTALGIAREEKSLGYATQQVSGTELTKARETNVVNSLAGKVAGVRVTSQSGTLGGSSKVVIRGTSSFGGSNPLFVIDGLPISNESNQLSTVGGVAQGVSAVDFGNRAGDINPDDIESMNILKGAAATALYGARARDGAIIITTKKGAKGRTNVILNSSVRVDNPLRLPDFQNEFAQGNQGIFSIQNTNGWGPRISEVTDVQHPNFLGEQETLRAYPDNIRDFFKTGHTYMNSIGFESGGEQGDFRLGYTNTYQDGIVEEQKLKRNSLNLNAGRAFSPKFDVRTSLNYISTIGEGRPVQSSNNPNILTSSVYYIPRTVDMEKLRNNYVDPNTGAQITLSPSRTGNNPFWIIYNNRSFNNVERVYGNAILTYKPLPWLTITDNIGTDFHNEYRRAVTRPGTIGALTGEFFTGNIFSRTLNNDFMATATHSITNDIEARVLAGVNNYEVNYRREQSFAQNLTVDNLYTFTNAATTTTTNTSSQNRIIGVFGELSLSYKDFLFVSATGRNDWSSTLPVANRSYFYPSVSGSFVFSQVIPTNTILSFGKLRASWANVGSGTDPYQTAFNYAGVSSSFAQYGYGSQFPFNGVLGFSIPSTIPNFNLRPQNQNSFELGTDLRFLANRVRLDFNYYNTLTSDQIISLSLPQSTGFAARLLNAGSIRNKGIEVQLGVTALKAGDLAWDTDINFSQNKQTVEDFPAEVTQYLVPGGSGWSGLQIRAREGEALGMFGTGWDRDPAGNIIIDPNTGLRRTKTDIRFGDLNPDWMLGINNTLSFKGLSFGFLVDIRKGGVIYSSTVASMRTTGLGEETLANRGNIFVDKGVIRNADGTFSPNTIPVQSMQDFWGQFSTNNSTEASVFDGSYAKLREVRLSYALPSTLFGGSKFVKGVDFGVEGRNLWIIFANIPHIDPEVNFFGPGTAAEGVEFNSMPTTRSFGLNLRARF